MTNIFLNTKNILKKYIPLYLRKKIRYTIQGFFFTFKKYSVPPDLIDEFNSNYMLDNNFDLINFGVIDWNFRYQRPQHLASNLAKLNHRVFYINPDFSPCGFRKNNIPFNIKKIDKNIYSVNLCASRNIFIHHDPISLNHREIIIKSFKKFLEVTKIINPIIKIDHPFWANIIDQTSIPIMYDCMDSHHSFADHSVDIEKLENKLFLKSTTTLVTSDYLKQYAKKNQAKNIHLITNACEYSHFHTSINKLNIPTDIKNIPHPIAGYFGAIAEWFDTEIIESIASNNPKISIVLIGEIINQKVTDLSKKYKNLYLLGEKPYDILPNYLSQFDSCLIPFKLTNLIKATHPVKIYEYFASGKPVVSTKIPEILKFNNLIYFANNNNFSIKLKKSLKEKNNSNQRNRQLVSKDNTWQKQTAILIQILNQTFFPKISIIVLSYNHPDLIKLTLDSLIKDSLYPNLEIIVVDNASNSETIKLLKTYPQIKLILNKENYGFAKGNNIGLKASTGEYLILLNNDVVVTPGWVSRLLFHCQKPNIGLVGPVTNSIGNEAKIDFDLTNYQNYTYLHWGQTLEVKNIAAFCWIMSRQTYQKIGELDERFGRGMFEDDDYCYRVKQSGLNILIADDVFVYHFGGASFKQLANVEYQKIFDQNKLLFENKWGIKWTPHHYR